MLGKAYIENNILPDKTDADIENTCQTSDDTSLTSQTNSKKFSHKILVTLIICILSLTDLNYIFWQQDIMVHLIQRKEFPGVSEWPPKKDVAWLLGSLHRGVVPLWTAHYSI